MELECNETNLSNKIGNSDIIYNKISKSLYNSQKLLHKKAMILVNSIHKNEPKSSLEGIEGIINYTKHIINLMMSIISKETEDTIEQEDILNYESLLFVLAVCVNHLPRKLLKNPSFLSNIFKIISFNIDNSPFVSQKSDFRYIFVLLNSVI